MINKIVSLFFFYILTGYFNRETLFFDIRQYFDLQKYFENSN